MNQQNFILRDYIKEMKAMAGEMCIRDSGKDMEGRWKP